MQQTSFYLLYQPYSPSCRGGISNCLFYTPNYFAFELKLSMMFCHFMCAPCSVFPNIRWELKTDDETVEMNSNLQLFF